MGVYVMGSVDSISRFSVGDANFDIKNNISTESVESK